MSNVFYNHLEKCASARMEKQALSAADMAKMVKNRAYNPAQSPGMKALGAKFRKAQSIGYAKPSAVKAKLHHAAQKLRR